MIDLDKFICSLFNNGYGTIGIRDIKVALKDQGLEYKEGAIKPIESMSEFKEGDILYNKDSYASDSIFIFKGMSDKTNAYLCYARLYNEKDFSVYSKEDWDEGVGIYGGEFYPANHKQKELLFSEIEKAGYKWNPDTLTLEKIEKPDTIKFDEPDFDNMVKKFLNPDKLRKKYMYLTYQEAIEDAYRKGLEDMWNKLKVNRL